MKRVDLPQPPVTCLVTGAAGFIGSHLAEALVACGYRVIGVDAFLEFYPRALKQANLAGLLGEPAFELIEADLRTTDIVALLDGVDYVFHLAGQPGVRTSWGSNFSLYVEHNVLATQRLLEASKQRGVQRVIYASSSSVYGNSPVLPSNESVPLHPVSPYGVTKLAGEHLCSLYTAEQGLPTISLRFFSVYGPRQRPDMGFHKFIRALLLDQPISIYGDGEQSRDFTYVGDIVSAALAAMQGGRAGLSYNLGGGVHVTVNEVLSMLEEITGRHANIRYLPRQVGDAAHTVADTTAARVELGFEPTCGLEDGLRRQVDWLSELLLESAQIG